MARIALGSNVREGPRRGKVVGHRPQGMVDVQFEDVKWVERRQEQKLRKGNPKSEGVWYLYAISPITGKTLQKAGPFYRKSSLDRMAKRLRKSWKNAEVHQVASEEPVNWFTYAMGYNPAGADDVYDPAKEQFRRVQMAVYESQKKRGKSDKEAWRSSFAIATKRLQQYGYLKPGTQTPTAKGRMRAAEKLASEDSWAKRQRYEVALAKRRKSGKHRVVPQKHGKQTRYYVQPGGRYFLTRKKAEGLRDHLNTFLEGDVLEGIGEAMVANRPVRKNWLPAAAAVLTIADIGYRSAKDRKKKKKEDEEEAMKNPRTTSTRGRHEYRYRGKKHHVWDHPWPDKIGDWSLGSGSTREAHYWMHVPDKKPYLGRTISASIWRTGKRKIGDWNIEIRLEGHPRGKPYKPGTDYEAWYFHVPDEVLLATPYSVTIPNVDQKGAEEALRSLLSRRRMWKRFLKNPRFRDERGGMGRGIYGIHRAARNALGEARSYGYKRGKKELQLAQVPPSPKDPFPEQRAKFERELAQIELLFKNFLTFTIDQIPSAPDGRRSQAQKRAMGALRGAYNDAYGDVLLEQERKRAARKARKTKNPKKKRMKGIAKAGVGYHWGDVRGTKPYQGMRPTLFREDKTFYLAYEGRSNKIPRVIADANSAAGLKGPKWKRVKSVTSALWKDVAETPTRYAIAHPKSGRGSKSDPYRIYDKEKGKFFRKTFTVKKEAEKFLWEKQGGTRRDYSVDKPRTQQVRSDRFAGEQITAYSTTSLSRAQYIAANLTFLDVAPGVFDRQTFQSRYEVEKVGPYRIHKVTERPPVGDRRRFFPKTYTLVVPGGVAFENRPFKSPEAAATFALRQRVSEQGGTLRQDLQALGKAMPRYKKLGESEAAVRSYVRYLRVYGFDVVEESEGKGKERETWYTVKSSPKAGSFADTKVVPVTLTDRIRGEDGKIKTKKRKAFALQARGTAGGTTSFGTGTKAEMEKLKKAKMKAKPSGLPTKAKAQAEINRLQSLVDKAQDTMEKRGTPGRPGFVLLAHGSGGGVKFGEDGFDLIGPVGKVTVSLDREPKVEQIWLSDALKRKQSKRAAEARRRYQAAMRAYGAQMTEWEKREEGPEPVKPTPPKRYAASKSLGHPELDWMAALYSKKTGLSRRQKQRLREQRQERAESELMAREGRAPGVKAPSKRRAQISQFQYQIRDMPQDRKYKRKKPSKRSSRKLSDREKKLQRLAEIEEELKKNPYPYRKNDMVKSSVIRRMKAEGFTDHQFDYRGDHAVSVTFWNKGPLITVEVIFRHDFHAGGWSVTDNVLLTHPTERPLFDRPDNKTISSDLLKCGMPSLGNAVLWYTKERDRTGRSAAFRPESIYRKNFVGTAVRGALALAKTPMGKKIAIEAGVIATIMIGEKLVSKGKVSPKAMSYIQRRVEQKTGVKPSQSQVKTVLNELDANKDKNLTDVEIIEALELLERRKKK